MSRKPLYDQAQCSTRRDWLTALLVLILAALPFLQVASFSFVNYDDPQHISEQAMVLSGLNGESLAWSMGATPTNLWHPLTWISYLAEVSFFGGGADSPGVHHLGNLGLHLGVTVFFFLLLRSLHVPTLVSAAVALVFSIHPLHVEPVAWVSSRKDVLYGFFCMASLFCYSRSRHAGKKAGGWFWGTLITMLAAMASKPSAVVLPGLFVLIDYLPRSGVLHASPGKPLAHQPPRLIKCLTGKWPYFLLAGLLAVATVTIQHSGSHQAVIAEDDRMARLSLLPARIGFYLQHTLWPARLCFDYATPTGQRLTLLTIAGGVALLAISWWSWRMRHRFPAMAVGWLWFLLCLAPVLGFFYVGPSFTADRYTYLALAGPALIVAAWVDSLAGRRQIVALSALLVMILLLGAASHRQTEVWKDNDTLFTYGVSTEPLSDLAQTNLARVYSEQGKDDLALQHYRKALDLDASRSYLIHCNIAVIQRNRGEAGEAIRSCRLSLENNDRYAPSHHLLGQLLEKQGRHRDEALFHLAEACRIGKQEADPQLAIYAYSCGLAYAKRGQYAKAERVLRENVDIGNMGNMGNVDPEVREKIDTLLKMLAPYLAK